MVSSIQTMLHKENTPDEQIQIKILPQQIEGKETLNHSKALSKI
jgi:hypothetical protein